MKKIFIRSPYYVTVNEAGQIGSKIELRFRYFGDTFPTDPNYVLSKKIPSPTQLETVYNISNYAKAFIKAFKPVLAQGNETNNAYVFCEVKLFEETATDVFDLLTTEEICCLNGYSNYLQGLNFNSTTVVLPLFNPDINIQRSQNIALNVFLNTGNYFFNNGDSEVGIMISEPSVYTFLSNGAFMQLDSSPKGTTYFNVKTPLICEPKYTPYLVYFINRLGGWQPLTFFKASKENYQTKSEKYKTFPSPLNYDLAQGQSQKYNNNGQKSITLNTGWVDENYNELIEDLLLSEKVILANGTPLIVKTESQQIKTRLTDKMINFEIEFMYNFDMINNV